MIPEAPSGRSSAGPGGSYHSQARLDILELASRYTSPSGRHRALDVGCASGVFARSLFSIGYCQVWGVEPDTASADLAAKELSGVVRAPFPNAEIAMHAPFDLIVFGDSLEHLSDPWTGLRAATSLLTDDGTLILTVPNIAHYSVLISLMRGRWEYADSGFLDRAHLRFFTPTSLVSLVEGAGLVPVYRRRVHQAPHSAWKRGVVRAAEAIAPHLIASKIDLVCRRQSLGAGGHGNE